IAVRSEVSPCLRLEESLCLLKALPFRDRHARGRRWPHHADNLSAASAEIATSCIGLRIRDALRKISSGLRIKRFQFGDSVGFFGCQLSIYSLHRRATESGSCNHWQYARVPTFHDNLPLAPTTSASRPLEPCCGRDGGANQNILAARLCRATWPRRPRLSA